jgi:hypothetical protein
MRPFIESCTLSDEINKRVLTFSAANQPNAAALINRMVAFVDANKGNFVISVYSKFKPTLDYLFANEQVASFNLLALLLKYEI